MSFSVNVYKGLAGAIRFEAAFNLYDPSTLYKSRVPAHLGVPLPGIKTEDGKWERAGHPERLLTITEADLSKFSQLFEAGTTRSAHVRLPQIHGRPLLSVLEKMGTTGIRLRSFAGQFYSSEMFHEAYAQRDKLVTRTAYPTTAAKCTNDLVLMGPLIFVATPWSGTARHEFRNKNAFDAVDLLDITNEYLPRSAYSPGDAFGNLTSFWASIEEWPKPSLPGYWPISNDDLEFWEALCGEDIKLYAAEIWLPECKPPRRFGYFSEVSDDVPGAITWLRNNGGQYRSAEFYEKFRNIRLVQGEPDISCRHDLPMPITRYFRYAHRRKGNPANLRTLMPTLIPPGVTHIDSIFSIVFKEEKTALKFLTSNSSIAVDFIARQLGKIDFRLDVTQHYPILSGPHVDAGVSRTLRLVSVTSHYAPFWERNVTDAIRAECWAFDDPRLGPEYELPWPDLPKTWQRECALRSDFARR
jgi:hypothetical protein